MKEKKLPTKTCILELRKCKISLNWYFAVFFLVEARTNFMKTTNKCFIVHVAELMKI